MHWLHIDTYTNSISLCESHLMQQLMQASEEHVAHRVKQHLVTALVNQGISDAVGNQASALRR